MCILCCVLLCCALFFLHWKGLGAPPGPSRHGPPDQALTLECGGEGNKVSDRHRSEHRQFPTDWFLPTSGQVSQRLLPPRTLGPDRKLLLHSCPGISFISTAFALFALSNLTFSMFRSPVAATRRQSPLACLCAIVSCQAAMLQCCNGGPPAATQTCRQQRRAAKRGCWSQWRGGWISPLEQPVNLLDYRQNPLWQITSTLAAGRL